MGKPKLKKRRNRTHAEEEHHTAPTKAGSQPASSFPTWSGGNSPSAAGSNSCPPLPARNTKSSPHWKQFNGDACEVLPGGPAPSFTYCFNFIKLQLTIGFMGEFRSVALLSARNTAITFFEMKAKHTNPNPGLLPDLYFHLWREWKTPRERVAKSSSASLESPLSQIKSPLDY